MFVSNIYPVPNEETWKILIKLWGQNFSDSDGTEAKIRKKKLI